MTIQQRLRQLAEKQGLADMGFFRTDHPGSGGLGYGITLVARLSDAVVDEITDRPTHSYFHHYRTVNAYLDRCMLETGLLLQQQGWRYIPVGASQSIPTAEDPHGFHGRFPHKQGACLAALGVMGTNGLFLHRQYGPRVRLGTVFTDCPLVEENPQPLENRVCEKCGRCVSACPANAIKGVVYQRGMPEFSLIDPQACSQYMKQAFQKIGRGAVCGICMKVCPYTGEKAVP